MIMTVNVTILSTLLSSKKKDIQALCTAVISVCGNDAFTMTGAATSAMLVMLLSSSEKQLQLFLLPASWNSASICGKQQPYIFFFFLFAMVWCLPYV